MPKKFSTFDVNIPDYVLHRLRFLAEDGGVSVEAFIADAASAWL